MNRVVESRNVDRVKSMWITLLRSVLAGATLLTPMMAGCANGPSASRDVYGTAEPFAAEAVYFVVTDRFADGDASNNYPAQGGAHLTFDIPIGDASNNGANIGYLGGDFQGVLDHADYITDMGFTAVWITPIVDNPDQAFTGGDKLGEGFFADRGKSGYHGYWGTNFFRADEHLVSSGLDFASFAEQLQSGGLKLVLDIVGNHGSPSFSMPVDQPGFGELYNSAGVKVADHDNLEPEHLDHGNPMQQWFHPEKDLAQLSNLKEDNPAVVDYLVDSYLYWIDQGADAFRIDTIKHMPHSFWKTMSDRVRAVHPGYFMFAESFSYDASKIAQHMQPKNGGISVLDFPGQQAMIDVFENPGSDFSRLLDYLHLDDGVYPNPYELMTFYDNHDMARMNASDAGFIDAHNWLFTSRGIPVVYYGSEVGFMRGAKEHFGNRNYFGAEQIARARTHPIYRALSQAATLRRSSIALQRGVQVNLDFEGNSASFLRVYQRGGVAQTALVMLNKGDTAAKITVDRFLSPGTWTEAVTGVEQVVSVSKSTLTAHLEPHSVRVWLSDAPVIDVALHARLRALHIPGS